MSPRQVSREFYNQQQRSVLGFGIYYVKYDTIHCINVDLISDNLSQTGFATICGFKWVINFKNRDYQKISLIK